MKIHIDIYHHFPSSDSDPIAQLRKEIKAMTQKLTDALAALTDEVADSTGKLESIKTADAIDAARQAVSDKVDALAVANVADDQAADAIDAARQAVSDKVDDVFAAVNANPAPGEDTQPAG